MKLAPASSPSEATQAAPTPSTSPPPEQGAGSPCTCGEGGGRAFPELRTGMAAHGELRRVPGTVAAAAAARGCGSGVLGSGSGAPGG